MVVTYRQKALQAAQKICPVLRKIRVRKIRAVLRKIHARVRKIRVRVRKIHVGPRYVSPGPALYLHASARHLPGVALYFCRSCARF